MKPIIPLVLYITVIASLSACSNKIHANENNRALSFTDVRTDYSVSDKNNYGCKKIDISVLNHILQKGTVVSRREVHDEYGITGCKIEGDIRINGIKNTFVYDYGGIIYFSDGMILGCGSNCCNDDYPKYTNCSWSGKDKK